MGDLLIDRMVELCDTLMSPVFTQLWKNLSQSIRPTIVEIGKVLGFKHIVSTVFIFLPKNAGCTRGRLAGWGRQSFIMACVTVRQSLANIPTEELLKVDSDKSQQFIFRDNLQLHTLFFSLISTAF